MKKESDAIKRLCDAKSQVSSHYFIKNNGEILNLVPDLYEAWHAGKSSWKNYKSINKNSIGIEVNNPGHDHVYKKFYSKQIISLTKLLRFLKKRYNIKTKNILGHSDIAPFRKKDPGEKFPWNKLAKKKLCKFHSLNERKIKIYRNLKLESFENKKFLINLHKIGYSEINKANTNKSRELIIKAFQRRYRQDLINGKPDKECLLISKNLTN